MRYWLIIAIATFTFGASAQSKIVGKVTDENNQALFGVTVMYKQDVTIGAYTDENGNYL